MAIQYVGGATSLNASAISLASLTGGIGGPVQEGDFVLVGHAAAGTTDQSPLVTQAGFTNFADLYGNDTIDTNLVVAYKRMGATPDASVTVNSVGTVTADAHTSLAMVFRGVDPTTPFDVTHTTAAGANSGVPNPPSITPVTAGAVVVAIVSSSISGGSTGMAYSAAPSGFSSLLQTILTTTSRDGMIGAAHKFWSGSGAEDPGTFATTNTATSSAWAAYTIALRPAPSGAPVEIGNHNTAMFAVF